jgi:hypothetical protein
MRRAIGSLAGFVIGGAVGLGTLLALGAAEAPGGPKYSVISRGSGIVITVHDNNKSFLYEPANDPKQGRVFFRRVGVIDLNQTGKAELRLEGEN